MSLPSEQVWPQPLEQHIWPEGQGFSSLHCSLQMPPETTGHTLGRLGNPGNGQTGSVRWKPPDQTVAVIGRRRRGKKGKTGTILLVFFLLM